nr:polysaccharide deacetylase family protein [Bradyrhizobium campsiandrae]
MLFHRFFFEGETREFARDRLKRQCDWLSRTFKPLRLGEAEKGLSARGLPEGAVLVTIDDAKVEILDILDIFRAFSIPIAIFACVGWCAQEETSETDGEVALARLIADLNWYRGPARKLKVAGIELVVGQSEERTAGEIDQLLDRIRSAPTTAHDLPSLCAHAPRISCTFAELADISSDYVAIGGHSVSHINLGNASPLRQDYEIQTTKRILDKAVGRIGTFAYPYGMNNTHSPATRRLLEEAGFDFAFLTHSGLATSKTDHFALPRISMPDRAMSDYEFRTRCAGAGILYRKLRLALSSHRV